MNSRRLLVAKVPIRGISTKADSHAVSPRFAVVNITIEDGVIQTREPVSFAFSHVLVRAE